MVRLAIQTPDEIPRIQIRLHVVDEEIAALICIDVCMEISSWLITYPIALNIT